MTGDLPEGCREAVGALKASLLASRRTWRPARPRELALEVITDAVPEMVLRLGRPHALQQHQDQEPRPRSRRRIMPAATSITASASTAWRRP